MKEMSRLTGISVLELKSRRMEDLKEFTEKHHITCVLKDSSTGGIPGERASYQPPGNASMAKAGAGDVLAGIVAGLMAQGWIARRQGSWGPTCTAGQGSGPSGKGQQRDGGRFNRIFK